MGALHSSNKTKNVRDPNLGIKMSSFSSSVNYLKISLRFLIKIIVKLLFKIVLVNKHLFYLKGKLDNKSIGNV